MKKKRRKENNTELEAEVEVEARKILQSRRPKSNLGVEAGTKVQDAVGIAAEVDHKIKGSQNMTVRNQGGQEVVHLAGSSIQLQKEINTQNLTHLGVDLGTGAPPH